MLHRLLFLAGANACPFVDVSLVWLADGSINDACREHVARSLDYLASGSAGLVVISNSDHYWSSSDFTLALPGQAFARTRPQEVEVFGEGLTGTVQTLQLAGHRVLVVQAVPHWDGSAGTECLWNPQNCNWLNIAKSGCSVSRALDDAIAGRRTVRSVVHRVTRRLGAHTWTPVQSICPRRVCSTDGPGFVWHPFSSHISVDQAVALMPSIETAITGIGGS